MKFRVGTLDDIVVGMFFILHRIEAFEDKVKESLEIFGTRGSDENVGVPETYMRSKMLVLVMQ